MPVQYKVVQCYAHQLQAELDDAVSGGWALHALTSPGVADVVAILSRPVTPPTYADKLRAAGIDGVTPVTSSSLGDDDEWVPTHRSIFDGSEIRVWRWSEISGRHWATNENGDQFSVFIDEWEEL